MTNTLITFLSLSHLLPGEANDNPTPVFLPGESHGQRSLVGYSLWSCKESDTTEQLNNITLFGLRRFLFVLVTFHLFSSLFPAFH